MQTFKKVEKYFLEYKINFNIYHNESKKFRLVFKKKKFFYYKTNLPNFQNPFSNNKP